MALMPPFSSGLDASAIAARRARTTSGARPSVAATAIAAAPAVTTPATRSSATGAAPGRARGPSSGPVTQLRERRRGDERRRPGADRAGAVQRHQHDAPGPGPRPASRASDAVATKRAVTCSSDEDVTHGRRARRGRVAGRWRWSTSSTRRASMRRRWPPCSRRTASSDVVARPTDDVASSPTCADGCGRSSSTTDHATTRPPGSTRCWPSYAGPPRLVRHEGWDWHVHVDRGDDAPWAAWLAASAALALATRLASPATACRGASAPPRCGRRVRPRRAGRGRGASARRRAPAASGCGATAAAQAIGAPGAPAPDGASATA